MESSSTKSILDLPYELWRRIFLLISPDDVLVLRLVCRSLYTLTSSEALWKELLENDIENWTLISHSHNPLIGSSRPAMDLYRICRPRKSELGIPSSSLKNSSLIGQFFGGLKYIVNSLTQNDPPRVAIFGPGIESAQTSKIVPQLLGLPEAHKDLPVVMKLVEFLPPPSGAAGLGTGGLVELLPTGQKFHMVVLYTSSKGKRERLSDTQDRLANSPFFIEQNGVKLPNTRTKELFSSLSGMIYVVDSTVSTGLVPPSCDKELQLLCQSAFSTAPLLVLAAFGDGVRHISPVSCVKQLELCSMIRPWQVSAISVVEGCQGLSVPVNWLGNSATTHS